MALFSSGGIGHLTRSAAARSFAGTRANVQNQGADGATPGAPFLNQIGFRARNDDGTETTATWKAGGNGPWTQNTNENFRVRFVIDETASVAENNVQLQLQYNRNSTGWVNVTGSSSVVRAVDSTNVSEEQATTRQLGSGSGTFFTGAMDNLDGLLGTNNQIDFTADGLTEIEFCLQLVGGTVLAGDTIQLRVIRSTPQVLEAYTQIPTITVGGASVLTGYFVSPTATGSGNGDETNPWTLQQALTQGTALQGTRLSTANNGAGGTVQATHIYLRGGNYNLGTRSGTAVSTRGTVTNPIIFKRYPGETPAIRALLRSTNTSADYVPGSGGEYTWWWGLIIENTDSGMSIWTNGLDIRAGSIRYINCIVRDFTGSGIGFWRSMPNSEVHNCLVSFNGWYTTGAAHADHGIYTQNETGTHRIDQCVTYANFGYGLHAFNGSHNGETFEDNVCFQAGISAARPNLSWIPQNVAGNNPILRRNMVYSSWGDGYDFGYDFQQPLNVGGTFEDNWGWFAGSSLHAYCPNATFQRNHLFKKGGGSILSYDEDTTQTFGTYQNNDYRGASNQFRHRHYTPGTHGGSDYVLNELLTLAQIQALHGGRESGSTYSSSLPTSPQSFVHVNRYEAGRGMVTVFNFPGNASVSVDVSSILSPGDSYRVYEYQNIDTVVMSGTYGGGTLSFSMAAVTPRAPRFGHNGGSVVLPQSTGIEFHCFLLERV